MTKHICDMIMARVADLVTSHCHGELIYSISDMVK